MDLGKDETIFDKLEIPYDSLRNLPNPVKPITEYYRKFLRPGEEVWWLDQDEPKSSGLIIKLWNNLNTEERREYMLKAMILFPEIFSNRPDKFNRLAVWLVNMQSVVCPNIRDVFTAGGQGSLTWEKRVYSAIPQIIIKMINSIPEIKYTLSIIETDVLNHYWVNVPDDKYGYWINSVLDSTKKMRLPFNLGEYLNSQS